MINYYYPPLFPVNPYIPKQKRNTTQSIRDNERTLARLKKNGFKIEYVTAYIDRQFGTHVSSANLLTFAHELCEKLSLKLDRIAKRNKNALICWYAENWHIVQPHLKDLTLPLKHESDNQDEKNTNNNTQENDPMEISQLLNHHDE